MNGGGEGSFCYDNFMILANLRFTLIHGKNNCTSFIDHLLTLLDNYVGLASSG